MPNNLVLWDLDGTITDSISWASTNVPAQFHEFFGWEEGVNINLIRRYFNNGWVDFTKKVARELGKEITEEQAQEFARYSLEEKNNAVMPLCEGASKMIIDLHTMGIKLALTSNNEESDLKKILKKLSLIKFFNAIIGYDSIQKPKPNGEMYLKACEILGVDKTETVVIEDSVTGLKASHHAQIPVVAVTTGIQKAEVLKKQNPTILVKNLTQITPEQILTLKYGK